MKMITFRSVAALLAVLILTFSCSKKKDTNPSFTGNYVIKSAQLSQPLAISTVEAGDISLPAGTDFTTLIQTALLSSVSCSSAANSYVELRSDYSLYLSCQGSNSLNAGTWSSPTPTSITLNLNSAAIPASPSGMVLNVTGIVSTSTGWTGSTSVPLPKVMVSGIASASNLTLSPSSPDIFMVNITVVFSKQ